MIQLREEAVVQVPLKEAFEYTADFSKIADWDPGIAESSQIGGGPIGIGTGFRLMVSFGSSRIPMTYTITSFEPPNRVELVGEGSNLRAVDEITFTQDLNGTRILYVADLHFKGPLRFAAPFLAPLLKRTGRKAVRGLASALEARVTTE